MYFLDTNQKLNARAELIEIVLNLSEETKDGKKESELKVQEEDKSSKGLILKQLPKHLKYAILGEKKSKLVIAIDSTSEKEEKVVEILKKA